MLTTPVVRCLRNKYPDAEIHYATKKGFQSVLVHNPYITKLHLLEDSFNALVKKLKTEKFDYIVDLHHNQRTLLLKWMLGRRSHSFNKLNYEKWLMVNFKINRLPNVHIVDRYLDTCSELGVQNDGLGLDYFLSETDKVDFNVLPAGFESGYLGWVIGAKQNTKKFPVEKITNVLNRYKGKVLLLGGKEDITEGEEIIRNVSNGDCAIYNAAGKFSLNQSAYLVKQASAVVTNDTGLMHIAAAFKRPIVSVWGNTIPAFGMYPYYGDSKVNEYRAEVNGLSCRPCSKLGYEVCPQGHFKCMLQQDEERILSAIQAILNNKGA